MNPDRLILQAEMKLLRKELTEIKLYHNIEIQVLKQILNELQRRPISQA